jgi:deoxyhypusine monooxygenase
MWAIPSFDELKLTLEDPSSPIGKRMRAAYYCKQLFTNAQKNNEDAPEIVELLCQQVFELDHGSLLRHEFAYVLGQMQTPLACQTLHKLLVEATEDCVMVRHEAAEALGAIASSDSTQVLESTYQKYTGSLNELADTCRLALHRIQHPDAQVGCACMLAPYSSVDPVAADPQHADLNAEELGDLLCDESLDLVERYRAMFSLRNRGGEECVQQLCRALITDQSSSLLRHEVAFVLGQLQHPSSIDALETSLARKEEHVMVRHESAEALGAIDVTEAEQWKRIEDILHKYQKDDDPAVAESCVVALDAADYWGHAMQTENETQTIEEDKKEDSDVDVNAPASNFGQHKRMDEKGRKDVLAQHFNVAIL